MGKLSRAVVACVALGALVAPVDGAFAAISGTSGQMTKIPAPSSALSGALPSTTTIWGWDEQQGLTLASNLRVDINQPGTYTAAGQLQNITIPAGTVVDSHMLDADHATAAQLLSGTVQFPTDVLGIIVAAGRLQSSDILGAPQTTYPGQDIARGLEFGQGDSVVFPDLRTVTLNAIPSGTSYDQIRIITKHDSTPTVDAGGPYTGQEGTAVQLHATAVDPEGDPLQYSWSFGVAPATTTCTPTNANSPSPTITCNDDALVTASVSVSDPYHSAVTASASVTISNVAPLLGPLTVPTAPVALSASVPVSASFTDAGKHDTHSAKVDWGDLSTSNATISESNGAGTLSAAHTYAHRGIYTITVTLQDDDHGVAVGTASVTVNGPPTANAGGPYTGSEGTTTNLSGTATDPENDTLTTTWTFTPTQSKPGETCTTAGTSTLTPSLTCDDVAVYDAKLGVDDGINPTVISDTAVTINNVAPVLGALGVSVSPVAANAPTTVSGSFTDAGTHDTHSALVSWGDLSSSNATINESHGAGTLSATHSYAHAGLYTVTVTLSDDNGGTSVRTTQILVNTPPVVDANGPYVGFEGSPMTLVGTATDADGDPLTYTWAFTYTGDNGVSCTVDSGGVHNIALTLTCTDDAVVTATLTASDGINTVTSAATTLTVGNAAPVVGTIVQAPTAPPGSTVAVSASFTDAGTNDIHSASIDWGDGHVTPATVTETPGTGTGSVDAHHAYATDGSYSVTVTVTDDDQGAGTATQTVVSDTSAPLITPAVSPAPNGAGWNDSPATVTWTVTDSLSSIDSTSGCDPTTVSSDTAGTTFTCTASSRGGTSSASVTVKLDQVAPTLTGAPTAAANANGWYNHAVTIHWSCSDALSHIAGSCPANSTLSSEGSGLSSSATVFDVAGNETDAQSEAVNIDITAPVTVASAVPTWSNSSVVLTLTASDNLSGVDTTSYSVDGGPTQTGSAVLLSGDGVHNVTFWSVDLAGNVEMHKSAVVKIDTTAPTITSSQAPSPNVNGWNNTDVVVSFDCNDSLSGIASCTGPQTISSEGANQLVAGHATDNAGNSASASESVSIDKTPPTITASVPVPNANGWYNGPVTASFTCHDTLSGVASCSSPQTVSSEGANQTLTGSATDAADNSATGSATGINIDETAPSISASVAPTANDQGWNAGAVTVHFTCADALSGVAPSACPPDQSVSAEGISTVSGSVSDRAGNSATAYVTVRIDTIAPSITGAQTPAANGAGWNNTDVTVSFTCTDSGSGIAVAGCTAPVTLGEGAGQSVTGTAVDVAGNTATTAVSGVDVDETAPTLTGSPTTAANGNGWYDAPVTIQWSCSDALSGIAPGACPPDSVVSGEGSALSATATVDDVAGNQTQSTSAPVRIDQTAPSTTVSAVPDWTNADVTLTLAPFDALSGVATTLSSIDGGPTHTGTSVLVSGDGIHVVKFWSVDRAGNVEDANVATVKIDTVAPTITVAQAPGANGAGWNNGDVTVTFTCHDAASGVAFCTPDQTLTNEGAGQTVSGSALDAAGNSASVSTTVNIDRTPPSIAASVPPANGVGWYSAPVTVSWSCGDALSGVATCPSPSTLSSDGAGQSVSGTASDVAGNSATTSVTGINIDQLAPTVTASVPPTATGWYTAPVTVHFSCSDNLSGVVSCPPDVTVSAEGVTSVAETVFDNAGNSATASVTVRIDHTPPTIVGQVAPPANGNGWNNSDVNVTFTCNDTLSGLASCTGPRTLHEGAHQSVSGTATDVAGNSASAIVSGINVDETPPTLSGAPTTSANANGWYNHAVTIHWTCGDALSGVDTSTCPTDAVIGTEGSGQRVSGTVFDLAGNATTASSQPVNVDLTAPVTTVAPLPTNWTNSTVTVTFVPTDNLSGVAKTNYSVNGGPAQTGTSVTFSSDGVYTVSYFSTDKAGNVESTHVATVKIDTSAPSITASVAPSPNGAGWNNTNVTVTFSCNDALSGIASCTPAQLVTSEGAHQLVGGTATDNAGNTASTTANVSIDKTPPTISGSLSATPNSFGWFRVPVSASFTCGDALSGVATCTAPVTLQQGANQFANGTATDVAGNSTTTSVGPVNVDLTKPTIVATTDRAPNAGGTYDGPVTVHFTCTDALSGIAPGACPSDVVVSADGSTTVSGTTTDRAGNTATVSIVITISQLRAQKQTVLIQITAAQSTATTNNTQNMLQLAARDLSASIDPSLWAVGNDLQTPSGGVRVFEDEKQCVQKLQQLIGSSVPRATLNGWIATLTNVDRVLATTATNEAIAAHGTTSAIQQAQAELAAGDQSLAASDQPNAIEHYKNAWQQAEHAMGKA